MSNPVYICATGCVMNNNTLTNVPGLSTAVEGGTYLVKANIWGVSSDWVSTKPGFALSDVDSSTVFMTVQNIADSSDQENVTDWNTEPYNQGIFANQDNGVILEGIITITSSATFSIQLNTYDVNCTIYPSSHMMLYKTA